MDLNRHWYRSSFTWLTFLLLPLSWLFHGIVNFRRLLYWLRIKKNYLFTTPIIIVGNITVGGTGKTPFVIWLANYLREQGWRPGIVSRGYTGKENHFAVRVEESSDPRDVGDEAILLASRSNCPVMVCTQRVEAVRALLKETDCNLVISDDGLQHYRLSRQMEIAILDGERRFGNKQFIPAGPLRESISRLKKVDFVVTQLGTSTDQHTMSLLGETLYSVQSPQQKKLLTDLSGMKVHAVAAIGNPKRFFTQLRQAGLEVTEHSFPDHYFYQPSDLEFGDGLPVIMTEKDAVKCKSFQNDLLWYLPVDVQIEEDFSTALLKKLNETIHARGNVCAS
jgi:tetraacyldisaccharide 4'-kinase